MTPKQAYEWLAPKLTSSERSALDVIFNAVPQHTQEGLRYGCHCDLDPCFSQTAEGDFGLSLAQLEAKYSSGDAWGQHPDYPREDWQYDVSNGDTRLGYWEWVLHNVESHYHGDGA